MKEVLVACEFSGTVRDAFRSKGFDAFSCDIRPCESDSDYHFQEDALVVSRKYDWDCVIAHPPCTYLANSGVRWLYEKENRWQSMIEGAVFFRDLLEVDADYVAVENPVIHKWAEMVIGRGYDFSVQPYEFGHAETKRICFWTKNLPKLEPTEIVDEREARVHKMPPGEDRSKERSRFFEGVASAMADQWGDVIK